ncbi:hypothetical protein ABZY45_25615 [Streptomyces sp. NPDC006516]|uniref:hypothetical protein n=1 Tax=Streptomyces sp. NPDC006516 TaxID=3154309 RepID=UPI0033BB4620
MLPPRLLWCDPRPIPRFNRQEPVTLIVRDPGFSGPGGTCDPATGPAPGRLNITVRVTGLS